MSKIFSAILEGWSPRARKRNREEEEEKKDEEQGNEKIDAVEEILQRNTKEEKKQEKKPKETHCCLPLWTWEDLSGKHYMELLKGEFVSGPGMQDRVKQQLSGQVVEGEICRCVSLVPQ